jgi:hypothetical protein
MRIVNPETLAHVESVDVRKPHIQQDQVDLVLLDILQAASTILCPRDTILLLLQSLPDERSYIGLIFDQKNMRLSHGERLHRWSIKEAG